MDETRGFRKSDKKSKDEQRTSLNHLKKPFVKFSINCSLIMFISLWHLKDWRCVNSKPLKINSGLIPTKLPDTYIKNNHTII